VAACDGTDERIHLESDESGSRNFDCKQGSENGSESGMPFSVRIGGSRCIQGSQQAGNTRKKQESMIRYFALVISLGCCSIEAVCSAERGNVKAKIEEWVESRICYVEMIQAICRLSDADYWQETARCGLP